MRKRTAGSFIRVCIPHLIEDDEYKCSICGRRFRKDTMICPGCGVLFDSVVVDEEEYEDEAEEMEAWDDEDGI